MPLFPLSILMRARTCADPLDWMLTYLKSKQEEAAKTPVAAAPPKS